MFFSFFQARHRGRAERKAAQMKKKSGKKLKEFSSLARAQLTTGELRMVAATTIQAGVGRPFVARRRCADRRAGAAWRRGRLPQHYSVVLCVPPDEDLGACAPTDREARYFLDALGPGEVEASVREFEIRVGFDLRKRSTEYDEYLERLDALCRKHNAAIASAGGGPSKASPGKSPGGKGKRKKTGGRGRSPGRKKKRSPRARSPRGDGPQPPLNTRFGEVVVIATDNYMQREFELVLPSTQWVRAFGDLVLERGAPRPKELPDLRVCLTRAGARRVGRAVTARLFFATNLKDRRKKGLAMRDRRSPLTKGPRKATPDGGKGSGRGRSVVVPRSAEDLPVSLVTETISRDGGPKGAGQETFAVSACVSEVANVDGTPAEEFLFRVERQSKPGQSCTAVFLLDVHGAAAAKWQKRDPEVYALAARGPGNLTATARKALASKLIRHLRVQTSKKREEVFEAAF